MKQAIQIHPADNIAVALMALPAGTHVQLAGESLTLAGDIPAGHKFAIGAIPAGGRVIKYGQPIGVAVAAIGAGAHVHTHNLKTLLSGEQTYTYAPQGTVLPTVPPRTFMGYPRRGGNAGVRNELWIIPTVGCVNDVATELEHRAGALLGGAVERVRALTHPYGCSQMGEDQEHTREILANLAVHPNAGGVLVLGWAAKTAA